VCLFCLVINSILCLVSLVLIRAKVENGEICVMSVVVNVVPKGNEIRRSIR
jgi:hypothetical protein